MFGSILINSDEADKSLGKTDKEAEKVGNTFLNSLGSAAKWGAGVALAGAVAFGGVVIAGVKMSEELQKSLNGIQSATGYSDESMAGMKDTMLSIYNNNFGENFEDIGKAIEEVGKQTGETGKELETLTTNALMLRDTFEFEVVESTRAATMMIKQFGDTGTDAYNLIAQGAQWGLDKNGDLLDSINEYSVSFASMGLSSEDMFNIFLEGAEAGVISTDKIGDSIKEFGIRTKDGSEATSDAFKKLGLDAEETGKAFAKGGETGKKAFEDVNKRLFEMKDPMEQNTLGVALYGTMWEDVGAKGIKALSDTNGEISKTTDALKGINDVKYATFGEAMVGIKRNFETGILIPLGDLALPLLNKLSKWMIDNMPLIKTKVAETFDKIEVILSNFIKALTWLKDNLSLVAGFVIGLTIAWTIQKAIILATNIALLAHNIQLGIARAKDISLTAAIVGLYIAQGIGTAATWLGTAAMTAFNLVMSLNPIALVVIALAALGIGIYEVVKHWKEICTWIEKAWNWLNKWNESPFKSKAATVTTTHTTKTTGGTGNLVDNANGNYGFAVGTRYLPSDMIIQAHEGEMIVPKSENPYANSKGSIVGTNNNVKTPVTIQLVLQNGKAIAEFLIDDIDNLMGGKNKVTARSVGI